MNNTLTTRPPPKTVATGGPSRELRLLDRYRSLGDLGARDELVDRMMPLVRRIARTYPRRGHHEDLVQVASLGLLKAFERFDVSLGVPLPCYAAQTMLGEVRHYLRDNAWAVRPSSRLQERGAQVSRASDFLTVRLGRSPTLGEVAVELCIGLKDVGEALMAGNAHTAVSLDDRPTPDDEAGSLADIIGEVDRRLGATDDLSLIGRLCRELSRQDRLILYLRFVDECSQKHIAERVGVSQMQISRRLRAISVQLGERSGDDLVDQHIPVGTTACLAHGDGCR